MKFEAWEKAILEGRAHHEWMDLEVTEGDDTAVFRISRNPISVDGVWESMSGVTQQLVGDLLGGLLLTTPKLFDLRWARCDVQLRPMVSGLVKYGGTVSNTSAAEHTEAVLAELAKKGIPRADDVAIGGIGKCFALTTETKMLCNHGWPIPPDEKLIRKEGRVYWNVLPGGPALLPSWVLEDVFLIQLGGYSKELAASGQDPEYGDWHDAHHEDYSQKGYYLHPWTTLNGGQTPTADILVSPVYSRLATHHGLPLPSTRVPGVQPTAGAIIEGWV